MNHTTIAASALRLLSDISPDYFISGAYSDGSRCCAVGHYVRLTSDDPSDYSLANCSDAVRGNELRRVSEKFMMKRLGRYSSVIAVNDGKPDTGYTEAGIKDRIVRLLNDMVDAGY